MTTTPDPRIVRESTVTDEIVREQAREIILSHAKDVEYMSIGEIIADLDEFSSLPEDEFDRVQGRIDKQIRHATVTVSFPAGQDDGRQAHPSTAAILRYFEYDHLPPHLADVSMPFHDLAHHLANRLDGPELTAGLRKLLEAKDCFVRAAVEQRRVETEESSR